MKQLIWILLLALALLPACQSSSSSGGDEIPCEGILGECGSTDSLDPSEAVVDTFYFDSLCGFCPTETACEEVAGLECASDGHDVLLKVSDEAAWTAVWESWDSGCPSPIPTVDWDWESSWVVLASRGQSVCNSCFELEMDHRAYSGTDNEIYLEVFIWDPEPCECTTEECSECQCDCWAQVGYGIVLTTSGPPDTCLHATAPCV